MIEPDKLFSEIEKDVERMEPNLKRTDPEFMSMALIILLALSKLEPGSELDRSLAAVSGYTLEFCGQVVANLEVGGAIKDRALRPNICKKICGPDGGMELCVMTNVALGLMKYHAKTQRFSLTDSGKLYVEKKLL